MTRARASRPELPRAPAPQAEARRHPDVSQEKHREPHPFEQIIKSWQHGSRRGRSGGPAGTRCGSPRGCSSDCRPRNPREEHGIHNFPMSTQSHPSGIRRRCRGNSSPPSTPRHCLAYRGARMRWACTARPMLSRSRRRRCSSCCANRTSSICRLRWRSRRDRADHSRNSSGDTRRARVSPRAAYSHSASLSSR